MDEKQEQKTEPAQAKGEESVSSTLAQAEALASRLEISNKEAKELLRRQEEILSRALLSGRSTAGSEPEKPKVETPKEYKDRILKGQLR